MDINSCVFVGRVASDPEYLPKSETNSARITFRLAVSRNIAAATLKERPGLQATDYLSCVVFGPAADTHAKYIRKGKELGVRGQLQNNERTAEDGTRSWYTSIRCSEVSYGADSSKNKASTTTATTTATAAPSNVAGLTAEQLQAVAAAFAANGIALAPTKAAPIRLDGPPVNRVSAQAEGDLPVADPFSA